MFAALPGVPSEMKRMFSQEVVERLPAGNRVIRRARINCFGVGESQAEEMLGDLTARGRDPEIGITVHEATITLRIVAHGETAEACDSKIAAAKSAIREQMGELVFGEEDEQLEHVVLELCCTSAAKRWAPRRSAREDCSRAALRKFPATRTRTAGGSSRRRSTGSRKAVGSHSGPDKQAAITAALESSRQRLGADFVIFVGAFPHYNPDDVASAAPTSEVALAGPTVSRIVDYTFLGDATLNRSRAAKIALNLLRLHFLRS